MAAPPNLEEGQTSTRPPASMVTTMDGERIKCMTISIMKTLKLWVIILDGPYIPMKEVKDETLTTYVVKTRKEYTEVDCRNIEKNFKAKKILVCGIGADEYNWISACESTKEILDCLQTAHKGTQRVKE